MNSEDLPDIQDSYDDRGIALDRVGIAGLRYPTTFDDGITQQSAIAEMSVTVGLPGHRRGTHMSRMVELVDEHLSELRPRELPVVLKTLAGRLDADSVQLKIAMGFATRVSAPATGSESAQVHDVMLSASMAAGETELTTTVTSDVTSLCPCSKAISDYGAHNQRSRISLSVHGVGDDPYPLSVSDAVEMIRSVGSCPVFPTIKRPDERLITMSAHDNPRFVEDMARDLSLICRERGLGHSILVRNLESIHSHDAVAGVQYAPAG
jgi:GTP cyclohydrolase IB